MVRNRDPMLPTSAKPSNFFEDTSGVDRKIMQLFDITEHDFANRITITEICLPKVFNMCPLVKKFLQICY